MSQRSIFEEVSGPKTASAPQAPGGRDAAKRSSRRAIRIWLLILAHLVAVMVLVGGMTRLTDSGLSITEWAPVMGALPPMSDADWQEAFAAYKTTTEFQEQNNWMTLEDFKPIFWWEWGHRFLGRIIGLVWAVGFFWFLARRMIPTGWTVRLLVPGVLGGLQGAIGWWMVSSGLTGRLDVASYRLAVHLGLAFAIFALLLWLAFRIRPAESEILQARRRREPGMLGVSSVVIGAAFLQILVGALVAGIDAGRGFPTWPNMTPDSFLPPEMFALTPLWTNFFENAGLVQFVHRMLGYLVLALAIVLWMRGRRSAMGRVRVLSAWVPVAMLGQVLLGIVTVVHAAPLGWALAHQAGALVVVGVLMRQRFELAYPAEQKIARG